MIRLFCNLPALVLLLASSVALAAERPNILWITAEDHGPHLGCYGDTYATTPHLDALASRSMIYTRASSTAPVCAAARTTIITGMYAPSLGAQHMRSRVKAPEWLTFYPALLREAGYYCTNRAKEDYNIRVEHKGWHESSSKAHWKSRPEGKPFFAIFNFTKSHESQIRNAHPNPQHDPSKVSLPPYHPDRPEVRKNWAQYYDRLTEVDRQAQRCLDELKQAGLEDDTIVFYYADHGSGMPRGKRYAGWSGLHVPMIVHVPEKFRHLAPEGYRAGGQSERLVGFVDLAPTVLSLAGVKPPEWQHGRAFLGKYQTEAPKYSFGFRGRMDERPDVSRSLTDGRFVYIRNYLPFLPHGQRLYYQMQTPATRVWFELFQKGETNTVQSAFWKSHPAEELYDLSKDPHETVNLAAVPEHHQTLLAMRQAHEQQVVNTRDLVLLPEPMMHQQAEKLGVTPAELAKKHYDPESILPYARLSLLPKGEADRALEKWTTQDLPLLESYWLAVYLQTLPESDVVKYEAFLLRTMKRGGLPALVAAEILARSPRNKQQAEQAVQRLVAFADTKQSDSFTSIYAYNALDRLQPLPESVIKKLAKLNAVTEGYGGSYIARMRGHLGLPEPAPTKKKKRKSNSK
ncbi:sulfatase [Verrucomicrobiaceae bacterium N1E253]|uniref:Sulfatase n=1 Tax=Oceaniferula marina TaxID=2748318 RepID=A0A851GKZ5_9BACT|nr:sulfatase [Oceaniferula marina]NWK55845.1 sulfatase [Oceaniferula marina]